MADIDCWKFSSHAEDPQLMYVQSRFSNSRFGLVALRSKLACSAQLTYQVLSIEQLEIAQVGAPTLGTVGTFAVVLLHSCLHVVK